MYYKLQKLHITNLITLNFLVTVYVRLKNNLKKHISQISKNLKIQITNSIAFLPYIMSDIRFLSDTSTLNFPLLNCSYTFFSRVCVICPLCGRL